MYGRDFIFYGFVPRLLLVSLRSVEGRYLRNHRYGFAVNLVFKIFADSSSETIFPPSLTLGATLGVDSSYDGGAMVTGTPATLTQ